MRRPAMLLPALLLAFSTAGRSTAGDEAAPRVSEPIVLSGARLAVLPDRAVENLAMRAWRSAGWEAVPFQVDELSSEGIVSRTGDGRLDDADMLVFMADALGEEAPVGAWPPGVPQTAAQLVVAVSDPLRQDWRGFAYLFACAGAAPPIVAVPPLVSFDRGTGELASDRYTVGLARNATHGFVGLDRLSLFGGATDILDRSKLRADLQVLEHPYTLTEESLEFHTAWDIPEDLRRAGPVRVVLDDGARGVAYEGRIEMHIDLRGVEIPSEFGLSNVRASLDLSPEALPAWYSDANVPDGVPIDGQPDVVPTDPPSRWREIRVRDGRLVFLTADERPAGAHLYYRDDDRLEPDDTGDGRSYGDNGVVIPDPDAAFATGLHLTLLVLPVDDETSPQELLAHADHPLVVSVELRERAPTPSPTVGDVTATHTPRHTATSTVEAPPATLEPSAHRCFLPRTER